MRRWRRRENLGALVIALIAALVIHVQLVFTDILPFLYDLWNKLVPIEKPLKATEINRVAMHSNDWEANRSILPPSVRVQGQGARREDDRSVQEKAQEQAMLEQLKAEEEKKQEKLQGQVVDVAPTPDNSPPKNARFLSEHNTNVEKESVSRHRRPDYGVAQPRPTLAKFSKGSTDAAQNAGKDEITMLSQKAGQTAQGTSEGAGAYEVPDIKKRESLHLKLDLAMGTLPSYEASDSFSGNSDKLRLSFGKKGEPGAEVAGEGGKDAQTVALFKKPSNGQLDMVTGAPANDHITGVPDGEDTLLNTREFKYATFFNRVKRGVSGHWNPAEVYVRHDPYGNIYGVKDRYTVLNVELDGAGALKDVSVVHSCGLGFLDDEAIKSFQDASPFPNPPQGLLDEKGRISFQFGFYFEIGDRPAVRVFRSTQQAPLFY